ncbi:MAG: ATP-binding protein [Wenzhouxiangella sp.]
MLQLLLGAGLALLLALSLIALAVDRGFRASAESALEERLRSVTFLVLSSIEIGPEGEPLMPEELAEPQLQQPGSSLHAGVMTPAGAWTSPSLVGVVEQPRARLVERGETLFRGPDTDGRWFVYAIGLGWEQPGGEIIDLTIWAAEHPERLRATVAGFRGDLYRWMMLAALLVILAQLAILLLLLRPLRRVAREVREIESGQRDQLLGPYPRELQPLTANLNALMLTERDNAARYRRALGDLAHALKTPLAVMRSRLEEGEALDPRQLDEALDDMDLLIRRQLERAARSTRRTLGQPILVLPLIERLAHSIGRLYAAEGVQIEVTGSDQLTTRMDQRDLLELCGNLVDNAAKYGAGRIAIRIDSGEPGNLSPGLEIEVEDNGPGIPAQRFDTLLQRGMRDDERREGQGLGLAIAQQLVESYAGRLELLAPGELGGCRLRILLPPR